MKICPTCNKEFPDDQKFCKYDGTPLAEKKAEAEAGKKCPKCGRTYPADAGFCMTCGAKLVALDEKSVCASCGAELPEGAAFCMKCGAKAGESGERVEEKISTRDLSEIDENHLEKYDLPTLCWARWECEPSSYSLKEKLAEYIKIDDVLAEEEKTNDKYLQLWLGHHYSKIQEHKNAFVYFEKSAKQGCPEAQDALSDCYAFGKGCRQDFYKEFEWAKKAASQEGYDSATVSFRKPELCYDEDEFSDDCRIDEESFIFQHLKIGAENGLEEAYVKLAECYENGNGCKKNDYEAFRWYKAAADRGDAWANFSLAGYYDEGKVCKQDDYEAFRCMKIAADSDERISILARYFLACYIADGSGCKEDLEEGLRLIKQAIIEMEEYADESDAIKDYIEKGHDFLKSILCTIQDGEYYYHNGKITITAERVNNVSDFETRNLELVLWLVNSQYKYQGELDGELIAAYPFNSGLKKGYGFTDINWTADVEISSALPHGEYYVVLTVNEESEDGERYPIVGWKNFERKIRI